MPIFQPKEAAPPGKKSAFSRESSSYRRLWWYSVVLTLFVALTPLIIMTVVHYYQYQKALQTELIYPITRLLTNTKHALESVIDERTSALRLAIKENPIMNSPVIVV